MEIEEVIIYGASDDLIEIEGSLREEFNYYGEGKTILAFSDGTVLSVLYDDDGIWKIRRVAVGKAEYSNKEAVNPDSDEYSDKVTLKGGNIQWVVYGREVVYKKPMKEDKRQ
jgi:hypothetical protein